MTTRGGSEQGSLQVETTEESPVVRTLEIEVGAERVRRAFDRAYQELSRRVRVRGFRPGKVPRSVLAKLYGPGLAEDVERSLVSETLPDAVEQSGLVPVSEPAVDATPPLEGTGFRYRARIEIQPPIELPELSGLAARRLRVDVGEEDVERELEALRQRQAVLTEEEKGVPARSEHVLTVDFEGRIDGAPFEGGTGREVEVELGSERFLPGFEEQLVGARAGEERTVRASFPDDHPNRELAGREAEFAVRVLAVRRRRLPALDDEFARDLGEFDSLDALRERIRADLLAARERQSQATLRGSLLDALIDRVPFDVPPGLVEQRLRRRLALAQEELRERVPPEALERQLAAWRERWRPLAEREVREQWLLDAVVRAQGIDVEDDAVDARLEEMAREQEVPPARLREGYAKAGLIEPLRAQMRRDQAVEFLLGAAKVEEVTGP